MAQRLRFDFWHIETKKGNPSEVVQGILAACSALSPDDENRLLLRETKVIRLQDFVKRGELWFGDFVGIGTKRGAKKGNLRGLLEQLQFGEDEGLCEENAFLIDPRTNVLVLQSNRMAATSSSVVRFLERFAPGADLDLLPVLSQSSMDRFSRLTTVSSFKVGIAKVEHGTAFADKGHSVGQLLRIASDLEAPSVSLEVSVGHHWRKQGLSMDGLRHFMQELLGVEEAGLSLERAEVTGRMDDDSRDVFDLAIERLREIDFAEPDEGRGVSRETRWQKLFDAFEKNEGFLKAQFGA